MREKFASENTKNHEFALKTEDVDYENLITKLKEISTIIALLEKTISK
tara:strand:+ start:306 stop:449 length:144 start_codon:yes stop_codon:yes gene_type:complete